MAVLARLCRAHPFCCASVEATSGSWRHQGQREMFRGVTAEELDRLDPIGRLDGWREIPLQAIHARGDEWVRFDGQAAFIESLRRRYEDPASIELIVYERTGAAHEHIGFGKMAGDAKNRQREFFVKKLGEGTEARRSFARQDAKELPRARHEGTKWGVEEPEATERPSD
jgi:hypothetical protein